MEFNKPLNQVTFNDVVDFCHTEQPENIQLEYKSDFPEKGLAKIITSFSNTRGGLIIIGVEEGKNGKPAKYEGVKNGKLEDRVHQYAANISPIPRYEVHTTDDVNGKVFVIIRVQAGEETPYYVNNDSNLWVRTGNISNPVDIASPEAANVLFKRKIVAGKTRSQNITRADAVFNSALERGENERICLVRDEKNSYEKRKQQAHRDGKDIEEFRSRYTNAPIGTNCGILNICLQPFYPRKTLISPLELEPIIIEIRTQNSRGYSFPAPIEFESIPDGMMMFKWFQHNGEILMNQIYSNGFLSSLSDEIHVDEFGRNNVYISEISSKLYAFLISARKFYNRLGYTGTIIGTVSIKSVKNTFIHEINGNRTFFEDDLIQCLFDDYEWILSLDTAIINNQDMLDEYVVQKVKEIYWGVGYKDSVPHITSEFLRINKIIQ